MLACYLITCASDQSTQTHLQQKNPCFIRFVCASFLSSNSLDLMCMSLVQMKKNKTSSGTVDQGVVFVFSSVFFAHVMRGLLVQFAPGIRFHIPVHCGDLILPVVLDLDH